LNRSAAADWNLYIKDIRVNKNAVHEAIDNT